MDIKYIIITALLMGCTEHECKCPKYPIEYRKPIEKPRIRHRGNKTYIEHNGMWIVSSSMDDI